MATCFDNLNGKKLVIGLVHLLPMLGTPLYEDGNMDKMTEAQLHENLARGLADAEKGNLHDAAEVFAR